MMKITKTESPTVEIKERYTNAYLKSVSAFATFDGGRVYFGISDEKHEVIGVDDPAELKLRIENAIHDAISPRPPFSLETVEVDGKEIVVLLVLKGKDGPYFYNGNVYHRADTSSSPLSKAEVRRLIMEADDVRYDELPSTQQELDFSVLKAYLKKEVHIEAFGTDTLRTLGLITDGEYNRAAQLLADTNDLNSAYTDMVRFGETESIFLERKTIDHCSLLTQYDEAMTFFDRWYHPYEEVADGHRRERISIPKDAFREAIANAIIHRDFMIQSFVRVAMYVDRIEITSPGTLPKGISKEDFQAGLVSVLRNEIVASVFNRLHIVERFATGIKRIKAEYAPFNETPIFEASENFVRFVLPKVTFIGSDKPAITSDKPAITTSDREAVIIQYLREKGQSKNVELSKLLGLSQPRTRELLKPLIEDAVIEKCGDKRGAYYRLKSKEK
ncbi:MAG: putative DNA binding domain-containing protein [Acidobacteriota bacterium]|jgi:ATP-dependent DNA helicase RecG|nr:putative DNA binding domain-containing protein [Acidobacteriota bacterium]